VTTSTHRVQALRQRRKQDGLVRVELYLTPELAKKVREFISKQKVKQ
jgi:hypothetical protein